MGHGYIGKLSASSILPQLIMDQFFKENLNKNNKVKNQSIREMLRKLLKKIKNQNKERSHLLDMLTSSFPYTDNHLLLYSLFSCLTGFWDGSTSQSSSRMTTLQIELLLSLLSCSHTSVLCLFLEISFHHRPK